MNSASAAAYAPLMGLWRNLRTDVDFESFEAANPDRLDVRLLRLTTRRTHSGDKAGVINERLISEVLKILQEPNATACLKQDVLRVLAGLDYRDLKQIGTSPEGRELLARLASVLGTVMLPANSSESVLANEILLPSVQLISRELAHVSELSQFVVTFDLMDTLVQRFRKVLSEQFIRRGGRPDWQPLPVDSVTGALKSVRLGREFPWTPLDTACKIVSSLDNVLRFALHQSFDPGTGVAAHKLFEDIRDLAQVSWLTARKIGDCNKMRDSSSLSKHWERREITSLDSLFQFERLLGNYVRAAYYAAFALHQRQRHPSIRRGITQESEYVYLSHMGLWTIDLPDMGLADTIRPERRARFAQPIAASNLLKTRHPQLFRALEDRSVIWKGYGHPTIKWAMDPENANDKNMLELIFRAAFLSGDFSSAYELFGFKANAGDKALLWDSAKPEVLEFAAALAAIQQGAAPLLAPDKQSGLRGILRRLWKRCDRSRFTVAERLFIHHCMNSWAYLSDEWHLSRAVRHKAVSVPIASGMYDRFIDQVRYGTGPAVTLNDLTHSAWKFERDDDVFISLTNLEGHTLSAIAIASGGRSCCREIDAGNDCDYHRMIERLHLVAANIIERADARKDRAFRLDPPQPLFALGLELVEVALEANPNVRRILLHAQPMWDAVPWQYLINLHRDAVNARLRWLSRMKKRTNSSTELDRIAIWRVPGLRIEPATAREADVSATPQSGGVKFDPDDEVCRSLADEIKALPSSNHGIKSFVFHGKKGGYATRLLSNGSYLSHESMATELLEEKCKIAVLHVCYAAASASNDAYANETGGLPGFFLAHGAEVVVASSLPIRKGSALRLERYLRVISSPSPLVIESQYLHSVMENIEVGLFTLYSSAMAPRLDRSAARQITRKCAARQS